MIFIAASKDRTIYYDSLRNDNTYRFGGTFATSRRCPVWHFNGEEAKNKIKELLGLDPILHHGTRVIISNPEEEFIDSIKNGEFKNYIEETWWPIILKHNAKILIKYDGRVYEANVPRIFPIKEEDETEQFKTWIKPPQKINHMDKTYTIKTICFACNLKEKISKLHQGIAYFHYGMKEKSIRFSNRKLREKVFGYVEFDKPLNRELKPFELPNHYGFRDNRLWRKVKDLIEDELEAFGNKKLGLGMDRRAATSTRRSSAENRALSVLRKITKNWRLTVGSRGSGGGNGSDDTPLKEIAVQLSGLRFPNTVNIPRVDYGDSLKDFIAKIYNRTDKNIDLLFSMFVLSGDDKIMELERKVITVNSEDNETFPGPYVISINKGLFPNSGEYKLRLLITNIADKKDLDRVTRRFWVDMEPRLLGPFDVRRRNFSEILPDKEQLEWFLEAEGDNKYTLYYNEGHPTYLYNDENEDKLTRYISEIFAQAAVQLLIRRIKRSEEEAKRKEELPFDKDILLGDDSVEIYKEIAKTISFIRFQVHNLV